MRKLKLREGTNTAILFGHHDRHLKLIEEDLGVHLSARGEELTLEGNPEATRYAERILTELAGLANEGMLIQPDDVSHALTALRESPDTPLKELLSGSTTIVTKKRFVTPKTPTQKSYIDAIESYDIVIGIGPAGTGKTYLAMAMAVNAFKKGLVRRIILTRPAIEAGENLGFLPGDMVEKVLPYLRPLYDALYDMMEPKEVESSTEKGIIEVAPLAYMRGRTLNDAFVILDEAQNSTPEQMKMFLTRLGFDSKAVITGDVTQSDLRDGEPNGLVDAERVLKDIGAIKFIHLTGKDVVRHELVQKIIEAYGQIDKN